MVCIVTGSSRGLGRAIALEFGSKGHQVAIHYRMRKNEAIDVSLQIKESCVLPADVRDPEAVKVLVDSVVSKWGRIDVVVNNAGVTHEALMIKTSEEDFDRIINTNLKGPFNVMQAVSRHMIKQKSGHLINISSYAGIKGKQGLSAYSASKGGLIGLTKTAARELSRYNIMVNAVLPGYMLTDMGINSEEKGREMALRENLIQEFSDPQRVAEFILFLAQSQRISGQVFNLDSRIL